MSQILGLFHAAYGRAPLEGMEKRVKITAWRMGLEDVPVGDLLPLAQAELRARTSPFLPTPADLLRRWRGEDVATDGDHSERVTVANAGAYTPVQPTANELAARALPEPEGDGRGAFLELQARLDRERAKWPATEILDIEKMNDRQVLQVLAFRCNAETYHPEGARPDDDRRAMMVAFARWFIPRHPLGDLTPELATTEFAEWQKITATSMVG